MASTHSTRGRTEEFCDSCEGRRQHDVSIRLVTENGRAANAPFSREPYRIAECASCGATTRSRMSDA